MSKKKDEKKLKRNRVRLGFTDSEFEALTVLSQRENLSPSGYLRKLANKKIIGQKVSKESVKPIDDDSRNRVWATLTDHYFKKLKEFSEKEGVKHSDIVREAVIHLLESTKYIPTATQEELQELRFLLRNVANNVNQMAWHSNRIKYVVDENKVFVELQKLEKIIVEFVTGGLKSKENDS